MYYRLYFFILCNQKLSIYKIVIVIIGMHLKNYENVPYNIILNFVKICFENRN